MINKLINAFLFLQVTIIGGGKFALVFKVNDPTKPNILNTLIVFKLLPSFSFVCLKFNNFMKVQGETDII